MATQEENIKRFMLAKEKAKKLIQMDVNGEIDKVKANLNENNFSINDENIQYLDSVPQQQQPQEIKMQSIPQQNVVKNNKLPVEILESMVKNKIDTSTLGNGISSNGSILDQLDSFTRGKLLKENNPKPNNNKTQQKVTEQVQSVSQPIDYSIIKMIVEEAIRKYSTAMKKSILSESKKLNEDNSLQAMKIGNKFSFITKNGDLYEANLKFIKNINK